jgi:TonB family protein
METLALPDATSSNTVPELHLLPAPDHRGDWRRWRTSAAGSLGAHVVVLIILLLLPSGTLQTPPPERQLVRHVTPLFIPPELTQKAPNKSPVKKELTLESIAPRPILKAPAPAAPAKQAQPAPPPPPEVARTAPKPVVIEPPKIETQPTNNPAPVQIANSQPLPPPGSGAPKLELESVQPRTSGTGRATGAIAVPNSSIQEAVRSLNQGGAHGPSTIGDTITDEMGSGPGLNLPSSAGQPKSSLQLRSDPMGVDFRPYMIQVLAAIRRNWFAVYPEAARLGMRGQVVVQFRVAKQGLVAKVIFNGQSNAKALDQSAVAAISASNPLPPLPVEFKGDHVDLQMTFLYNMPR